MTDAEIKEYRHEDWLREARETIAREKADQSRHREEASRHLRLAYMCGCRAVEIGDEIERRVSKGATTEGIAS